MVNRFWKLTLKKVGILDEQWTLWWTEVGNKAGRTVRAVKLLNLHLGLGTA